MGQLAWSLSRSISLGDELNAVGQPQPSARAARVAFPGRAL
jgi:hypothetical protein